MKRRLAITFLCFASSLSLLVGCGNDTPSFNRSDLVGKWVSGTEYYRYDADGKGATWDTADDVSEIEAQPYEWTLEGDKLTQIHIMEMGGRIPQVFTVTHLDASSLSYRDDYHLEYHFQKVK